MSGQPGRQTGARVRGDAPTGTHIIKPVVETHYALAGELEFHGQVHEPAWTYRVKPGVDIGSGGEAMLYHAQISGGGSYPLPICVKVYSSPNPGPDYSERRQQAWSKLMRISGVKGNCLMPLLDYAEPPVALQGEDIGYRRPLEVLPVCEPLPLGVRYSFRDLKAAIIPSLFNALKALHKAGLVHRDVKPANIFKFNRSSLVLGDYGTVAAVSTVNHTYNTRTVRGTPGYTPTEVMSGSARVESDYYSLGCTIATLYRGHHPHQTTIDTGGDLFSAIDEHGLPLGCAADDQEGQALQALVNALTEYGFKDRAKEADVAAWLENPSAFRAAWEARHRKEPAPEPEKTIVMEGSTRLNKKQLLDYLAKNWEAGRRMVFSRIEGSGNAVLDFIGAAYGALLQTEVINIVRTATLGKDSDRQQHLGYAKILYLQARALGNASCPIWWMGKEYLSTQAVAKGFGQAGQRAGLQDMLSAGFLGWRFAQEGKGGTAMGKRLATFEKLAADPGSRELAALAFQRWFDEAGARPLPGPLAYFKSVAQDAKALYRPGNPLITDEYLAYLLGVLDNAESLLYFKAARDSRSDLVDLYQKFFLMFEALCQPSEKPEVRALYHSHGPRAYLRWWQENIRQYKALDTTAQALIDEIANLGIAKADRVVEQSETLDSLNTKLEQFQDRFEDNYFLDQADAARLERTIVTGKNSSLLFLDKFLGQKVPEGFLAGLGLTGPVA